MRYILVQNKGERGVAGLRRLLLALGLGLLQRAQRVAQRRHLVRQLLLQPAHLRRPRRGYKHVVILVRM